MATTRQRGWWRLVIFVKNIFWCSAAILGTIGIAFICNLVEVRVLLPDVRAAMRAHVAPYIVDVLPSRLMNMDGTIQWSRTTWTPGDPDAIPEGAWPSSPSWLPHRWQFVWFCVSGGDISWTNAILLQAAARHRAWWYWQDLALIHLATCLITVVAATKLGYPCRPVFTADLFAKVTIVSGVLAATAVPGFRLMQVLWHATLTDSWARRMNVIDFQPGQNATGAGAFFVLYVAMVLLASAFVIRRDSTIAPVLPCKRCFNCGFPSQSAWCTECGLVFGSPASWPPKQRFGWLNTAVRGPIFERGFIVSAIVAFAIIAGALWPVLGPLIRGIWR